MRTILYKCEDVPNSSICAEPVSSREADEDEPKLSDCICITMTRYSDDHMVYLTREDALHFAETLKTLAETNPKNA